MLKLKNVSRNFGELRAIDNVNFEIQKSTVHGLIGPNGSGKTTLFNLISGFLKTTCGEIWFNGHRLNGKRPHQIAAMGITRTFQLTNCYQDYTALDNVKIGHHLQRQIGDEAIKRSALQILEKLGIADHKNDLAKHLPAGTQRTLSIATAVASKPKFLLLDEPLAGLHPTEKASVADNIASLKDLGLTVCIVEHDVKSVFRICDNITVINFGKKLAEGTPKEIRANRYVVEAYLGEGHFNA